MAGDDDCARDSGRLPGSRIEFSGIGPGDAGTDCHLGARKRGIIGINLCKTRRHCPIRARKEFCCILEVFNVFILSKRLLKGVQS